MSLLPTALQDAVVRVGDQFEKNYEHRLSEYGGFKALYEDTPNTLQPSIIESARRSARPHVVKVPVLNKKTATNVDADSCTPPTNEITSAFTSVSFSDYGFAVKINPEAHLDNYISQQDAMQKQLFDGFKKVYERLDTAALAFLEANKDPLTGLTSNYFTNTSGTLEYDMTNINSFYGKVNGVMRKMDLGAGGMYKEVANTEALTSNLLTQTLGSQNSQNFAGLVNGSLPGSSNFQTYTSNRVTVPTVGSKKEVRYIFPEGSFGVLNWLDPKARPENANTIGRVNESQYWTSMKDPLFGLDFKVHYFRNCEDASGTYSWLNATVGEAWIIICSVGFVTPYSSDSSRPNVKFVLA